MFNLFQSLFFMPSPATLARKELAEAERALLQSRSTAEYATQMVTYNQTRVNRLKTYVAAADNEKAQGKAQAKVWA